MGKYIFEVIFPMIFLGENFKTCLAFYFPALETLFLEHSNGKNNPEIANLEFENHDNICFHVYLAIEQAGTNIYVGISKHKF